MKNFCLELKEHAIKTVNYEKKEMIPLKNKENKIHREQKVYYICKKRFSADNGNKKYHKVRNHCHYTGKYRGAVDDIAIEDIKYQKIFLWYFIMVLHLIIIL